MSRKETVSVPFDFLYKPITCHKIDIDPVNDLDKVMNDATSEDVDGEYESDDAEMHNETAGDSVGSTPPELGLSPNREPDPSLVSAVAGLFSLSSFRNP